MRRARSGGGVSGAGQAVTRVPSRPQIPRSLPALDLARTAARRAERRLVALPGHGKTVRPLLLQYLNRVSDLLWLMARESETAGA